jgi:hypothetical protein
MVIINIEKEIEIRVLHSNENDELFITSFLRTSNI